MSLDIYQIPIVGFKLNTIIKKVIDSKNIDILDEWTNIPTGKKKTITKEFIEFNNIKYTETEFIKLFSNYKFDIISNYCLSSIYDNFIGFKLENSNIVNSTKKNIEKYVSIDDFQEVFDKIDIIKSIFINEFKITVNPTLIIVDYYSY